LPEALEDYRWLAEKDPDAYKVQYGLGDIAQQQDRNADALRHFNKYLEHAPRTLSEYTNVLQRVERLGGR
jgi:tetratricopeptide (TPR) repeat protein